MQKPRIPGILKNFLRFLLILVASLMILAAFQIRFDRSFEVLKAKYAPPPSQFMDLNGQGVHYRVEGDSFPLVLLHGTSASLHTWDEWTHSLVTHFQIIRVDLPAFGLTGPNETHDYRISTYVAFLNDFLETLGVESFHLAGNSLGGRIALAYTLRYPEKVTKLILIDPAGYPLERSPTLAFRLARTPLIKHLMPYLTPRFMIANTLKEVYGDPDKVSEALIDRYYDMTLAPGNRDALLARLNAEPEPMPESLDPLSQPVLLMWGELDRWIPVSHVDSFRRDISHLRVRTYPGVGHVPMEEQPQQTVLDALLFLKGD